MEPSITFSLIVIFITITIIPFISRKAGIPVIVLEIALGIIVGKSFLKIVPDHSIIAFFSSFGLTYLMFLAGLEIDIGKIREKIKKTTIIALFSVAIPFAAGYFLAGLNNINPFLLGTIFSTTSLGIILPLAKEIKADESFKRIMLGSTVIVDVISMLLLAIVFASVNGTLKLSFIYESATILSLFIIPIILEKIKLKNKLDIWIKKGFRFEMEVRFCFALILILGAISEQLGFHSIIGAFLAGLILSSLTTRTTQLRSKLDSFGYGFFIPLFFVFMGANVNLPGLFSDTGSLQLLAYIITAGICAKVIGVFAGSRLCGLRFKQAISLGFFHSARLSLIIAAADIAKNMNLISDKFFSIFVLMSLASALIGPTIGKYLIKKDLKEQKTLSEQ